MTKQYTTEDEIRDVSHGKPHVVILGSGASKAACPNGDLNGKILPTMDDLISRTGLEELLEKNHVNFKNKNFEGVFSEIYDIDPSSDLLNLIEEKVFNYFELLELPLQPTIYDHLALSLRKKDLIATFNWDPLLFLACIRNHRYADLPHIVYLHGNTAIGYCEECRMKGAKNGICIKCSKPYTDSKILFPIKNKNYNDSPLIKGEWDTLKLYLAEAYMLTIFGYGAPNTDIEAVELMKEGWGMPETRSLEEIEIIDIKDEEELAETWKPFIHSHHYIVYKNFYSSWAAKHPRRTCETMWQQLMMCQFLGDNNIPKELPFEELWKWYKPLIENE
ncbi:MAG: hypothetical protein Q8O95_05975 [bacterium]|nr:hypothetical protein [bacterium]